MSFFVNLKTLDKDIPFPYFLHRESYLIWILFCFERGDFSTVSRRYSHSHLLPSYLLHEVGGHNTEESISTPGGLAQRKASPHHRLCTVGKCGSTAAQRVVVKRISTTIERHGAPHLDSILVVSNACVWKYLKAIECVLYIRACSTNNFIFFSCMFS